MNDSELTDDSSSSTSEATSLSRVEEDTDSSILGVSDDVPSLKQANKQLRRELDGLRNSLDETNDICEGIKQERDLLRDEVQKSDETLASLKADLNNSTALVEAKNTLIKQMEGELSSWKSKARASEYKERDKEPKRKHAGTEAKLKSRIQDLERQLAGALTDLSESQKTVEEERSAIDLLKSELESAAGELRKSATNFEDMKSVQEMTTQRADHLQRNLDHIRPELAERNAVIHQKDEEISKLKQDLEVLKEEICDLKELRELEIRNRELDQEKLRSAILYSQVVSPDNQTRPRSHSAHSFTQSTPGKERRAHTPENTTTASPWTRDKLQTIQYMLEDNTGVMEDLLKTFQHTFTGKPKKKRSSSRSSNHSHSHSHHSHSSTAPSRHCTPPKIKSDRSNRSLHSTPTNTIVHPLVSDTLHNSTEAATQWYMQSLSETIEGIQKKAEALTKDGPTSVAPKHSHSSHKHKHGGHRSHSRSRSTSPHSTRCSSKERNNNTWTGSRARSPAPSWATHLHTTTTPNYAGSVPNSSSLFPTINGVAEHENFSDDENSPIKEFSMYETVSSSHIVKPTSTETYGRGHGHATHSQIHVHAHNTAVNSNFNAFQPSPPPPNHRPYSPRVESTTMTQQHFVHTSRGSQQVNACTGPTDAPQPHKLMENATRTRSSSSSSHASLSQGTAGLGTLYPNTNSKQTSKTSSSVTSTTSDREQANNFNKPITGSVDGGDDKHELNSNATSSRKGRKRNGQQGSLSTLSLGELKQLMTVLNDIVGTETNSSCSGSHRGFD